MRRWISKLFGRQNSEPATPLTDDHGHRQGQAVLGPAAPAHFPAPYGLPGYPPMYPQAGTVYPPIPPGFHVPNQLPPHANPLNGYPHNPFPPFYPNYYPNLPYPASGPFLPQQELPAHAKVQLPSSAPSPAPPLPVPSSEQSSQVPQEGSTLRMEASTEDEDLDFLNYPMGYVRRECRVGSEEESEGGWKETKWAWRSQGYRHTDEKTVEVRVCLGVLKCVQCGKLLRPSTDVNALGRKLTKSCSRCLRCPVQVKCNVKTQHFDIERGGEIFRVWEQHGEHLHERPPGGRLTQREKKAVDAQVFRRHDSTAHQLRTGDTGPGSVPLHAISPLLTDPRKARYQVGKSRERLGINLATNKGGFSTIHTLGSLNKELEVPFMVESQFHGPTYICLQTPFMEQIVKEAVESWIEDERDGPSASRHGFVTEGDHSYFQHGVLLVSCSFSAVLNMWVPVLYTWIDGQDINHHRPHFRRLFASVVKYAGSEFESKFLLHVMDFSGAQSGAHAEEYADTMMSLIPSLKTLARSAREAQHQHFIAEAQKFAIGCEIHFHRSFRRIKNLTQKDELDALEENVAILLRRSTSSLEFDDAVRQLRKLYPNLKGWLDWWLRPRISSMIFPARSTVDPEIVKQVPSSSNAAENQKNVSGSDTGRGRVG
ncbi:hypothetical protein FPV67DRAFT_293744 [Lyophyllum atratum]|nr:hypothetical protein FPV67DRAFT_293744 [Lyophyllum atratum]